MLLEGNMSKLIASTLFAEPSLIAAGAPMAKR